MRGRHFEREGQGSADPCPLLQAPFPSPLAVCFQPVKNRARYPGYQV